MDHTQQYLDPNMVTRADAEVTIAEGHEPPPDPRVPFQRGEVLGRYVVLDTLGAGGMGIVLAAYDSTLDRRVALKLLHPHASRDPESHTRLLREAQALAKLSHPAVVSVYDVGELRGQVFIAMEFIDGPNLRHWTRHQRPRPKQVIAAFRNAAAGLQAAHDAGIVHRDFKPDNVLIGPDRRAYVTDFGLALEAHLAVTPGTPSASASASGSPRLTETGMVMGTPAYMPVEQHRGLPTDHRSDQFSFAVSFYEALYGVRPFSGTNAGELCRAITQADIPPPPPGIKVPRRVHRAILRALSAAPSDRFPSMRAFLRAITPPTRSRRTWIFGGIGGLALGAGAVFLADPPQRPCSSFDERIADVYGPDQRAAIETAFTTTDLPYARASFDATAAALDDYAQRWTAAATDACLATERGHQSDHMLDLRMHCLDRGLLSFSAMVGVMTGIEQAEVKRASKLVTKLPELDLCSDVDILPSLAVLPATPEQSRDAERLIPVLEQVRTAVLADRLDEAAELLDEHAVSLRNSTYPVVQTLDRTWRGRLHFERLEREQARTMLTEAHLLALEHGLDAEASRTAIGLGATYVRASEFQRALHWFDTAAALARATDSSRLLVTTLASSSAAYAGLGDRDRAVDVAQQALDLVETDPSYPKRGLAELLLTLGRELHERDGGDAGSEHIRRAMKIVREFDGEVPVLAELETDLSRRAAEAGDYVTSSRHAEEALRIAKAVHGEQSARYAITLVNAAVPLKERGMFEEALEYNEQALAFFRRSDKYDKLSTSVLLNTANLQLSVRRVEDAQASLTTAAELIDNSGLEDTDVASVIAMLQTTVLRLRGDLDGARASGERALAQIEKLFGENHFRAADARLTLARVALAQGRYVEARRLAERARAFDSTVRADRARVALTLGRALFEAPGASESDRRKGLRLVRQARDELAEVPGYPQDQEEIDTWLEKNDRGFAPG